MKEYQDGRFYRPTLISTASIVVTTCDVLGTQRQIPNRYQGPLDRFDDGGRTMYGIFGHRDVTSARNAHDPGNLIFQTLENLGFERFDFKLQEDIETWKRRQSWLRSIGLYTGVVDGLPGPRTNASLKRAGFPGGIWMRYKELAEQPFPQDLLR